MHAISKMETNLDSLRFVLFLAVYSELEPGCLDDGDSDLCCLSSCLLLSLVSAL